MLLKAMMTHCVRMDVLFCSAGTGEDVDLELLVDDFVAFYLAGEQTLLASLMPVVIILALV